MTVSDSGFRVSVNAFGFENYGNEDGVKNLTPIEMRALFGDVVCTSAAGGESCALSPVARRWMNIQNESMNDGHCEGMSVLSALIYTGKTDAVYGVGDPARWPLTDNIGLQRAIARWFVTQGTSPGADTVINGAPSKIVRALRAAFEQAPAAREFHILGIYKRGEQPDGHALLPFALRQVDDAGRFDIAVYDSNFPGQTRYVEVDTRAETWRYVGSPNPQAAEGLYDGDAETESMDLTAITPRLGRQNCAFCAGESENEDALGTEDAPPERSVTRAMNDIAVSGDGVLVSLSNASGQRLGVLISDNGVPSVAREIPGGRIRFRRTPGGQPPALSVPASGPYTITLDGARLTSVQPVTASVIGRGYLLSVDDLSLEPGQRDTLAVDTNPATHVYTITYRTAQPETPVLYAAFEGEDVDYELVFDTASEAGEQQVMLVLNTRDGSLVIRNLSGNASSYQLDIERITETGSDRFEFDPLPHAAGASHTLRFGALSASSKALPVEISDGAGAVRVTTVEAR